jgi:serine/threonine protein kinase
MSNEVFFHNYKLLEKLGKGAFSTVFKGEHRINKKLVAIKVATTLKHESKILAYMNRELPGLPNVPTLYWYGLYGNNVCLATTYYTMSFLQYEDKSKLAEKMITAIKHLHSVYNVEKDVYRENIRTPHLIGSPKYASYNLHTGNTISPRDDLISIGYMIMTALGIELPWSSVSHEETDLPLYHVMHPGNVQRAKYKKFETLKTYLTDFPGLITYMEKVYALEYGETPDYKGLTSIF